MSMKKLLAAIAIIITLPAMAIALEPRSVVLTVAQTVTATAYEALDLVGGKITLAGAIRSGTTSGMIQAIEITDLAAQSGNYDVVFFTSDPSSTTFTDEAALDIADADLPKVVCATSVSTTAVFNDNGLSYASGIGCPFELLNGATTLYAAIIARSTPTFASTSDVQIRVTIMQD